MRALLAAALLSAASARAAEPQARCALSGRELVGFIDQVNRGSAQAQEFYHCFKKDRAIGMAAPDWLDKDLDRMTRETAWQHPEVGELSEARLWQSLGSAAFEFFERTKGTFPKRFRGEDRPPVALLQDYDDARARLSMALDHLQGARLSGSLGGRGKAVISAYQRMKDEMIDVVGALRRKDCKSYHQGVANIAALTAEGSAALNAPAPSSRP